MSKFKFSNSNATESGTGTLLASHFKSNHNQKSIKTMSIPASFPFDTSVEVPVMEDGPLDDVLGLKRREYAEDMVDFEGTLIDAASARLINEDLRLQPSVDRTVAMLHKQIKGYCSISLPSVVARYPWLQHLR